MTVTVSRTVTPRVHRLHFPLSGRPSRAAVSGGHVAADTSTVFAQGTAMATATVPAPVRAHAVKTKLPDFLTGGHATLDTLTTFLGVFSIGLGLAELLAPRGFAEAVGTRRRTGLLRAYGLREISAGVGLLTRPRKGPWLWGRVGGDVLDLATLCADLPDADDDRRARLLASVAAVVGVTALDVYAATKHSAK
jgi:hypothetical protein